MKMLLIKTFVLNLAKYFSSVLNSYSTICEFSNLERRNFLMI